MRTDASSEVIRNSFSLFLLLFVGIGSILGSVVAFIYHSETENFLETKKKHELYSLVVQQTVIADSIRTIVRDLTFMANHNELWDYLDDPSPEARQRLEEEYKLFADSRTFYHQIRYLDNAGQERVRINYAPEIGGHVIKPQYLQNKKQKHYFQQSLALSPQEIFISPLNLHSSNGAIEFPFKPIIHFGYPVMTQEKKDKEGKKQGVVILNYLADHMLTALVNRDPGAIGENFLLNASGYWLYHPDHSKEWGFMFSDKENLTFPAFYPEAWSKIQRSNNGQFSTENGLFSFQKIYPLQLVQHPLLGPISVEPSKKNGEDFRWILVSHIRQEVLDQQLSSFKQKMLLLAAGLTVLVAFGAWYGAMYITRRSVYQAQLVTMALYDPLTGLPNRKLFFDTLKSQVAYHLRHERKLAVLFIDLDGFKAVNDTHGHDAGDELLQCVAHTLTSTSRQSDMVARLGGDEFAIILADIHKAEDASLVADKIITSLVVPCHLQRCTVKIGASIGISVLPKHAENSDELVRLADLAMYQAKANGKNQSAIALMHTHE